MIDNHLGIVHYVIVVENENTMFVGNFNVIKSVHTTFIDIIRLVFGK